MNTIRITNVEIEGHRIQYDYDATGEWEKTLYPDKKLVIEYSIELNDLPKSIAVIPLIANILPIAWIYDAEILVDELDKDFFYSIEEFKKGYKEMYPMISFLGKITVNRLVNNRKPNQDGVIAFFSGGVDAFNTLVQHAEENPTLVTLWGADVKLDNNEGWSKVDQHIKATAAEFGIDSVIVKTGFREFTNEGLLHNKVYKLSGDGWWHGFQHGIGIICHAAPIAYLMGKKRVYFASSFTAKDKGKVKCASDPTIDNFVKFCGAEVVHDGYEFDRQGKIRNIVEFARTSNKKIALRVCWESEGGSNCCKCEKCWRTILGVYAEGENPADYGFSYSSFSELCKLIYKKRELLAWHRESRYAPIQNRMREVYSLDSVEPSLKWFYKVNLDKLEKRNLRKNLEQRIVNKVKRIFK